MASATLPKVQASVELPPVPAKRYFTIGEVSDLCLVKQHVLRYWEQEFTQLKPMKRRGNRRYYQHHEVMLIRKIRTLLYDEGFTISGARSKLESLRGREVPPRVGGNADVAFDESFDDALNDDIGLSDAANTASRDLPPAFNLLFVRSELAAIAKLLDSATL
jgi:DNA-binding transcriptional MerR regulator